MSTERRNQSALGRKRRREFERSVHKLRDLGMPEWAVEYYRRAARVAGLPPHMVVCHVAVVAAGRQMQSSIEQALQVNGEAESAASGAPAGDGTYGAVTAMQRRVASLWREIQRHSEHMAGRENAFPTSDEDPDEAAAAKVTVLRHAPPDGDRLAPRTRGRRPQPKGQ